MQGGGSLPFFGGVVFVDFGAVVGEFVVEALVGAEFAEEDGVGAIEEDVGGADGLVRVAVFVEVGQRGGEAVDPAEHHFAPFLLGDLFEGSGLIVEEGFQGYFGGGCEEDEAVVALGIRGPDGDKMAVFEQR